VRVHIFDAFVGEHHFRGFAFNKKGEKLKREMTLGSSDITLEPSVWEHYTEEVIHDDGTPKTRALTQELRARGFAVTSMPKPVTRFFVFDVELDVGSFRVYSADRELKRFREFRKTLELGVDGDKWRGEEERYIGELDISSKQQAKALGIEDYPGLLTRGYCMALVRASTNIAYIEKSVTREMNKKTAETGIHVTKVSIQLSKSKREPGERSGDAGEEMAPAKGTPTAPPQEPRAKSHIEAGTPIILAIIVAITLIGAASIVAGVVLFYMGASGATEMSLFGNTFKSQNVAVACLFIGALIVAATARRALTSVERLIGHPR